MLFSLELNQLFLLLLKTFIGFIRIGLDFGLKVIFRRWIFRGESNHSISNKFNEMFLFFLALWYPLRGTVLIILNWYYPYLLFFFLSTAVVLWTASRFHAICRISDHMEYRWLQIFYRVDQKLLQVVHFIRQSVFWRGPSWIGFKFQR